MLKKYNILIFILLLANNLMADDDTHKLPNDSNKYSKFNIHAGVGILNGTRLGINYRFNRNISINIDYGISTFIFFGIISGFTINSDLNYHFNNNSGPLLCPSITIYKSSGVEPSYLVPSFNVGYLFYNPAKSINSLQFRVGCGIFFNIDNQGSLDNSRTYLLPNFDIILGFQF